MRNEEIKVSIIIPHYNQKECLEHLFPYLADQTFKNFEVIVIDDCSPDKTTIPFIKELIKGKTNMRLIQNEDNLRFVRTCNKGIELAKGEYICLLNQDTEVDSRFIQRNVEILDSDSTIGGLTCSIVDQYGKNWFTGGLYRMGLPKNLLDDFEGLRRVDFIAGTAAFYRKDVFSKIGLFDENYIMYHEDIEFGLRMKHRTNYRLCAFADKLVTHILVPSMPRSDVWYYDSRNLMLLARQYKPMSVPLVIAWIMFFGVGVRIIRAAADVVMLKFSSAKNWMNIAFASILGMVEGAMAKKTVHSYSRE